MMEMQIEVATDLLENTNVPLDSISVEARFGSYRLLARHFAARKGSCLAAQDASDFAASSLVRFVATGIAVAMRMLFGPAIWFFDKFSTVRLREYWLSARTE